MAGLITKVFITSGLLGGAGGLGYTFYYLNGYNLGDKLQDRGYELLNYKIEDNSQRNHWEKILKSYSTATKKLNGKVITVKDGTVTDENINDLKKECANATSSKIYSEETALLTEKYCVKPVTVKELLSKGKIGRVLDWKTENKEDDDLWDSKINAYSTIEIKEPKLDLTESEDATSKRNKFKNWCQLFEGSRTHEEGYHDRYNDFFRLCVA